MVWYNEWRRVFGKGFPPHNVGANLGEIMSKLTSPRFQVSPLLEWIARCYLKLSGWKVEGEVPPDPKWIGVIAHHTSNWDFPVLIAASFYLKIPAYWLGKHTLFWWPLGWLLRKLGGVPIDRRSRHNVVEQAAQAFDEQETFVLGITPEGTRKRTDYWKTGFYYIAQRAKVRFLLVFIDWKRKACGLGPIFAPSGDLEVDMNKIREFYALVVGKYPAKQGKIEVVPRSADVHPADLRPR